MEWVDNSIGRCLSFCYDAAMKKETARKVLKQVKTHYNKVADEWHLTRQQPWFEFELYKEVCPDGARVLDIGCGNGRLFWQALKGRNVRYLGIDISVELLKLAEQEKKKLVMAEKRKVQFKEGSMTKIAARARVFDRTFCIAAFHHLPGVAQRIKGLEEMVRVTKKDGYLIISVWNLFQQKYRQHVWRSLWRYFKTFGKYDWNDTFFDWGTNAVKGNGRYYHAFTPWEMRALLRSQPLEIVEEFFIDNKSLHVPMLKAHNFVWICKCL